MIDFTKTDSSIIVRPIMADGNSFIDSQAEANRQKVEKWLREFGHKVENINSPKHSWIIKATDDGGINFLISQSIGYPNEIVIQIVLQLDGPSASFIDSLKPDELSVLISDLRLHLFMINAESQGLVIPFKSVTLSQYIYTDGLTQDALFQRMFHVRKGYQITHAMIQDAMADKS